MSFAGLKVIRELEKYVVNMYHVKIIGIEKQPTYFVSTTSVRSIVQPEFAEKAFIELDSVFSKNSRHKIMTGTVTNMDAHTITLASGETIRFNYAVISTGYNYGLPFQFQSEDLEGTKASLAYHQRLIHEASEIVIVGGGSKIYSSSCRV